jgi:hypothetical protein
MKVEASARDFAPRAAGVEAVARLKERSNHMMVKRITRLQRCKGKNGKIAHVWGVGPGRDEEWDCSGQYLLNLIALGSKDYYTEIQGQRARVVAKKDLAGEFYLTTLPDASRKNNLLEVEYTIVSC